MAASLRLPQCDVNVGYVGNVWHREAISPSLSQPRRSPYLREQPWRTRTRERIKETLGVVADLLSNHYENTRKKIPPQLKLDIVS